jgi:hypothetical protein
MLFAEDDDVEVESRRIGREWTEFVVHGDVIRPCQWLFLGEDQKKWAGMVL